MPELPEVETVRRGLVRHFHNRSITDVELRREGLRFPFPRDMVKLLVGRSLINVGRRAKYLLVRLSGDLTWVIHLGMSGHFSLLGFNEKRESTHGYSKGKLVGEGKHDHVVVHLDDGSRAVYTDPRRFGMMDVVDTSAENNHRLLNHLGPEPLEEDWTAEVLCKSLRNRRSNIKTALLDQRTVVGVGNIYACEALFQAKISPKRISSSIANKRGTSKRAEILVTAIKEILQAAIDSGGSTLNDFQAVDGELGYFTHFFQVYNREGEDCLRTGCLGMVSRILQGGRSTFYCPKCQR